ncbi:MAG TPA: Rrf2 family transcriptional regulator, partial [Candidatus Binatia bacterium]|nr:Rrf2 family transcriptional regulator [Candidatus Binatia bacterium]
PDQISFYDVIEALEGPIAVNVCMNEELSCDQLPRCAMVGVWSEIQQKVTEVFTRTTLADLRRTPCRDNLSVSSLSSAA